MEDMRMGEAEAKFADIIWEHEPVQSGELVKLAKQILEWKKSTTYTVLRRLTEKGIFSNEDGVVTSLISRSEYYATQGERFINNSFGGSLPAFFAAFTSRKKMQKEEIEEILEMIRKAEE